MRLSSRSLPVATTFSIAATTAASAERRNTEKRDSLSFMARHYSAHRPNARASSEWLILRGFPSL
jgi:hypothetical protein